MNKHNGEGRLSAKHAERGKRFNNQSNMAKQAEKPELHSGKGKRFKLHKMFPMDHMIIVDLHL